MKSYFNLDLLVEVELVGFVEYAELTWHEAVSKTFWRSAIPAGFRHPMGYGTWSAEALESGELHGIKFRVEDKKAYYKPYVYLHFAGGRKVLINFEHFEEAETYAIEMAKNLPKRLEAPHTGGGIKLPKRTTC